jgi:hypothetical protein
MGGAVDTFSNIGKTMANIVTLGGYDVVENMVNPPKGGDQVETPQSMRTETSVGNKLDAVGSTYNPDEEENKRGAVNRKRLGTRGLQIPLTTTESTTTSTPSTTGIQL